MHPNKKNEKQDEPDVDLYKLTPQQRLKYMKSKLPAYIKDPMHIERNGGGLLVAFPPIDPVMRHILALQMYRQDMWEERLMISEDPNPELTLPAIPKEPEWIPTALPKERCIITNNTLRETAEQCVRTMLQVRGFRTASYGAIRELGARMNGLLNQLCTDWRNCTNDWPEEDCFEKALQMNRFNGVQDLLDHANWMRMRQQKAIRKCERLWSREAFEEDLNRILESMRAMAVESSDSSSSGWLVGGSSSGDTTGPGLPFGSRRSIDWAAAGGQSGLAGYATSDAVSDFSEVDEPRTPSATKAAGDSSGAREKCEAAGSSGMTGATGSSGMTGATGGSEATEPTEGLTSTEATGSSGTTGTSSSSGSTGTSGSSSGAQPASSGSSGSAMDTSSMKTRSGSPMDVNSLKSSSNSAMEIGHNETSGNRATSSSSMEVVTEETEPDSPESPLPRDHVPTPLPRDQPPSPGFSLNPPSRLPVIPSRVEEVPENVDSGEGEEK